MEEEWCEIEWMEEEECCEEECREEMETERRLGAAALGPPPARGLLVGVVVEA